jgi:hypothetical protein
VSVVAATRAPAVLRWAHQETKPKVADLALMPRAFEAVSTPVERNRVLRALAVASAYVVDDLTTKRAKVAARGEGTLYPYEVGGALNRARFPSRGHGFAASTIARTWMLFPDRARHITVFSCTTKDGEPAVLQEPKREDVDVGFPPLLLAGIVVIGIAAATIATIYVSQMALDVIDRKLTRDADTQRMVGAQQQAVKMADDHRQREQAANKVLPWTDKEIEVLEGLLATQKSIANKRQEPFARYSPFDGALGTFERVAVKTAETVLPLVLLAGSAYFVLSRASGGNRGSEESVPRVNRGSEESVPRAT